MHFPIVVFIFLSLTVFVGCGGSSSGDVEDDEQVTEEQEQEDETVESDDTINTEKLIGTPFEGMTSGDDFDDTFFLCGKYRTDTIESFPIPIFTALFRRDSEESVQEAVELANKFMGFEAYRVVDAWSDDVRVIYAVDELPGAGGQALHQRMKFNGKEYAEMVIPDWAIEITKGRSIKVPMSGIAHELGHASGISGHFLIDYENDTTLPLEDNSVMDGSNFDPNNPALNDYSFMMKKQGEIMQEHLGETAPIPNDRCD